MAEAVKNTIFLDNWIKTQAFKYAYNDKTRGFIGKKYVKERVLTSVPRDFIALGHTRERIELRLNDMLANELTQALIKDCDEKRIKTGEAEASALQSRLFLITGDQGIAVPSSNGLNTLGITMKHMPSTPGSTSGISDPKLTIDGVLGVGNSSMSARPVSFSARPVSASATASSAVGIASGSSYVIADDALGKGKKPMTVGEGGNPNQKDIQLPTLPENRPTNTAKPAAADDSKDIFSRGGSTPQRSRSPESSNFISAASPPPLDLDIPFLPFRVQYRILITLQGILENACYSFARKHYPDFLARKGWDCPEAGELTHWTRGLVAEFRESPTMVVREGELFPSVLKGVDEIRHLAVHRVPVSGRDIQRLVEKTKVALHTLDATRRIRNQIEEIGGVIERGIHIVLDKRRRKEEKLRLELEKLEEWRRILELREVKALRQAEDEEENIQRSFRNEVGNALEALGTEQGVAYSISTGTEQDGSSVGDAGEIDLAQSEVREEPTAESSDSTPGQEEEYFHEPEIWPEFRDEV